MKINQAFVHGFASGDKLNVALIVVGDEDSIRITKCAGFDEWISDDTGIINTQDLGHEVPYNEMNIEMLRRIVVAWLHDEEFGG